MIEAATVLLDRAYWPAALALLALGVSLGVVARGLGVRVFGVGLAFLATMLVLAARSGAGDAAAASAMTLTAVVAIAGMALARALLARLGAFEGNAEAGGLDEPSDDQNARL